MVALLPRAVARKYIVFAIHPGLILVAACLATLLGIFVTDSSSVGIGGNAGNSGGDGGGDYSSKTDGNKSGGLPPSPSVPPAKTAAVPTTTLMPSSLGPSAIGTLPPFIPFAQSSSLISPTATENNAPIIESPTFTPKQRIVCTTEEMCRIQSIKLQQPPTTTPEEEEEEITPQTFVSGDYPTKGCFITRNMVYFSYGGTMEEMAKIPTSGMILRVWCD